MMSKKGVVLLNIEKSFGGNKVLKNLSLEVKSGEFLVLLGPSGCGKTTTLRCIAGLEKVDKGKIFIGDRDVTELPPSKRNISMVFQNYAVFPHMKVYNNIAFGLKMRKFPRQEIDKKIKEVSKLLKIDNLLDRFPSQLSGGQKQRVAVARALAVDPDVLLMDEPLSNLDALLRAEMRTELKKLHRDLGTTTVYVTHDQIEALSLGDRIAVMFDGEIVQISNPKEIYEFPSTIKVGEFIGIPSMNFLKARYENGEIFIGNQKFELSDKIRNEIERKKLKEFIIGIRAENIEIYANKCRGSLCSKILLKEELGYTQLLTLKIEDFTIKAFSKAEIGLGIDNYVYIKFREDKIRFFDCNTRKLIF